jgi:hypothetical protein
MIFVITTYRLFHSGCLLKLLDDFEMKCYSGINSHTESSDDGNHCNDGESKPRGKKEHRS